MTGDAGPASAAQVLRLSRDSGARRVRLGGSEKAAAVALIAVLFLAHLAFGATRREVALGLAAAEGLLLAIVIFSSSWARRDLARTGELAWPAALFAVVLLVALWSLTPATPGGPHPIWTFVQASPASALDKSAVAIELVRLLALGCVFLTAWLIGADDARARWFLQLLVVGAGLFAMSAFIVQLAGQGGHSERLSATFLSANTAGAFFGAGVLICTCALTDRLRDGRTGAPLLSGKTLQAIAPSLVALCFAVACLVLTASRGGFLATGAALVVFLAWEAGARRWRLFGLPGLGLVGLLAVLLTLFAIGGAPLVNRLFEVDGNVAGRREITLAHWNAFLASPWMGYGLGSFDAVNRLATTSQNYPQLWNIHATHNVYLQWLEEAGVLGAAPMFLCVGLTLVLIARSAWRRPRTATWVRGLAAASLVLLIHGVSDFALQVPSMAALMACLLGLGAGLSLRAPAPSKTAGHVSTALPRIAGAVGLVVVALAAPYAVEIALAPSAHPVTTLPLPDAYDTEAARTLRSDPVRARAMSLKALAIRPVDGRAWLVLATLDAGRAGDLGPTGLAALRRSYDVAPYDPRLISDRVALAYDHWSELPADIREQALSEMTTEWPYQAQKDQLLSATAKARSPQGKLALASELFRLRILSNLADSSARLSPATR